MDRSVVGHRRRRARGLAVHALRRRAQGTTAVVRRRGGPSDARELYEDLVRELRAAHVPVATGEFQAMMQVELVNDGPVTVLVDSKRQF